MGSVTILRCGPSGSGLRLLPDSIPFSPPCLLNIYAKPPRERQQAQKNHRLIPNDGIGARLRFHAISPTGESAAGNTRAHTYSTYSHHQSCKAASTMTVRVHISLPKRIRCVYFTHKKRIRQHLFAFFWRADSGTVIMRDLAFGSHEERLYTRRIGGLAQYAVYAASAPQKF